MAGTTLDRMHRQAITVAAAQTAVSAHTQPLPIEHVPLAVAENRYAATDIHAPHDFPPFRRSTMDGYAIRAEEAASASRQTPQHFIVAAEVPCGAPPPPPHQPGEAARTMTGAIVADGADAIVPLEHTESPGATISSAATVAVFKQPMPGQYVTESGADCQKGERLLRQGTHVGPGETAVLAACGQAKVAVRRRPIVAIVSTGTELLDPAEPLQPGKIRDSNAPLLAALVRQAGGVPLSLGRCGDDLAHAREVLAEAFQAADAVISTGGVSVGDYDVLTDLFLAWEGTTLFNKVAMRPGSPTTVGVLRGKLWFGLSGNPASCFVGFHLLARPALLTMQGALKPYPAELTAVLADDCPGGGDFTRFVRGRLAGSANGRLLVQPVGPDRSGAVTSLLGADCLIGVPPGDGTPLRAGQVVPVLRLE